MRLTASRGLKLAGAFGLAVGIVVFAAAPAFAHATLENETPAG